MTRSRTISRAVGLLRWYGGQESARTESFVTSLTQQGQWCMTDRPTQGTSTFLRSAQMDRSPSGDAFPRRSLLEVPCISPILSKRLNLYPWSLSRGVRSFSSAQPLPAKSSAEEQSREHENDFGSAKDSAEKSRKISASAVDVDKALEDYDRVLDQHRKYYASQQEGIPSRLRIYAVKAWSIIPMTWNLLLRLPVLMQRALFSSWADKKAWTQYQWKHLKDGARHYWVQHFSLLHVEFSTESTF